MIQFNYKLRKQKVCFKEVKDSPQLFLSVTSKKETKENKRNAGSAVQFLPP